MHQVALALGYPALSLRHEVAGALILPQVPGSPGVPAHPCTRQPTGLSTQSKNPSRSRPQTDIQASGQQRSRPHASEGAFGCVLTSAALAERTGTRRVSHRRRRRWCWRCCVVEDELWALGRRRTRSRSIDRLHLNSGGEAVSSSSSSTLRAESASRPSPKASSSCSSLLRVVHLAVGVRRKVRLEVGLLRRGLARCDALGNAIP